MVVENKKITAYKTVVINITSFLHSNTEENDVKSKIDILNWTLIDQTVVFKDESLDTRHTLETRQSLETQWS